MKELDRLKAEKRNAETEIQQLENRQKTLLCKSKIEERRLRTRRLIERGAMLESVFPELTKCENKGVMGFLIAVSRLPKIAELLVKTVETTETG